MAQLYTPFLTQAGAAIGRGLEARGINQQKEEQRRLAGSAYMGDPQAMEQLMELNPQMGIQLQQQVQKRKEAEQQKQLDQQAGFKKDFMALSKNIATFPDFESSKEYANEQMEALKEKYPIVSQDAPEGGEYTEEAFNQIKQFAGEKKEPLVSKVSRKDFTLESWVKFEETQKMSDLVPIEKLAGEKAPKTRNVREGKEIINQEWVGKSTENPTGWKEVGRGPMSQQQINLRSKPAEVSAGKEFDRILDQSNTAEDQLITTHKAKALLPNIETGKMEPIKQWAREWGDAFGVPVDEKQMVDAVSFRSVMKGAVLDGMKAIKGTASEADRRTVEESVAAMDNPEEANEFLLDVSESMARRKIEQANFWDRYASERGGSLLGAKSAWSKRIGDIPLVKKVDDRIHHYYKFKDQVIQANKAAFRNATEQEVNDRVDDMWSR